MTITIRGEHDQKTLDQLQRCYDAGALFGVLCADGHLGYSQPVGAVMAYEDKVSISGVGYDIGCGNTAVKTNINIFDMADSVDFLKNLGGEIAKNISFGVGRNNEKVVDHPLMEKDAHPAWDIPFVNALKRKASNQLGTVGSGNHYVDIFYDQAGFLWVGTHFGSRGLGHTIATHYLNEAGGKDGMDEPPTLVDPLQGLGAEYYAAMQLAGLYAQAGREWVTKHIVNDLMGATIVDMVENHHNFAWKENHFGKDCYVVRKGATPAFPDQRGFVGGSMGDISVILRGVDSSESEQLLRSTVHGAGRLLSRTQAAGKQRWLKNEQGKRVMTRDSSTGLVNEAEMREKIKDRGTILLGGGADEAPQCYRPLKSVLVCHKDTITIDHVLTPLIVVMAGADEIDPYKD